MADVMLAEYGRAFTIHFILIQVDGVDLRQDAVDGGANCIVMTDEAAQDVADNDFVDEGSGYSLVLTAAEMTGARITVYILDTATKVWLDTAVHIYTYGHALSAHPNLTPQWTNGACSDASASSTVFTVDGFTEATDDHVIGSTLRWTSGANLGQARRVLDYDDTTGTQTITTEAFLAAPADNDEFVLEAVASVDVGSVQGTVQTAGDLAVLIQTADDAIDAVATTIGVAGAGLGDITLPATGLDLVLKTSTFALALADAIWDEILTGATHNIATSAGRRLREFSSAFDVDSGTAQAGDTNTITLASTASTSNNIYRGDRIAIESGTGAGEHGIVVSYVGSTRVATMAEDWIVIPDNTSVYIVTPASVDVETVQHAVQTAGDLAALIVIIDGVVDGIVTDIAALQDVSAAEVNAEVVDALAIDTYAEPSSVPAATATLAVKISYVMAKARNKVLQTTTTQTLRNDGDSGDIAEATLSDDATTFTKTKDA